MGLSESNGKEHRYQLCRDADCPRSWCRIYREGRSDGFLDGWDKGYARGYAKGFEDGYSKGYDAGYGKGFPDGIAACPRAHK